MKSFGEWLGDCGRVKQSTEEEFCDSLFNEGLLPEPIPEAIVENTVDSLKDSLGIPQELSSKIWMANDGFMPVYGHIKIHVVFKCGTCIKRHLPASAYSWNLNNQPDDIILWCLV